MRITLSPGEVEVLVQMFDKDTHELVLETAKAGSRDYRESLKTRAAILDRIRAELEATPSP